LKDTNVIYVYINGVYKPEGEQIILQTIRKALGKQCTIYDRNEVKAMVRDVTLTDRSIFTSNPEKKVCLENGVLNLDTLEFTEHTPKEYFLSKSPVKYDLDAICPRIEEFLNQIVDKSDVQTVYEVVGYCLYPAYPIHKAFMMIGGGANGKSTLLNLIKTFLGTHNCSSISIQELEKNRFATSAISKKLANIYPDIPDIALRNTGKFKSLVGEDLIGAEEKFGKHFTFQNHAKLLLSANKIPETHDNTEAFFRRWMIINFPNQFTQFSTPKADTRLLKKLSTQNEMSGLLNKAVTALQELLDRGRFTGDKPTAQWREDYIRKSNPVGAFYMDCLEDGLHGFTVFSKPGGFRYGELSPV